MDIIRKTLLFVFLTFSASLFAADTVNINTADKATLMAIKGVGEKRAEAIIQYRDQNGGFESVDELTAVRGVGESTLEANRGKLTVSETD